MKNIISVSLVFMLVFGIIGCGSNNIKKKEDSSSKKDSIKIEEKKEPQVLNAGEWYTIKTDKGSYKFTVDKVNYLPATDYRDSVLQLIYEYENVDFKSDLNIGGINYADVCYLPAEFIKLVDNKGYVLNACSASWQDEWQEAAPIKAGEKSLVKMTYNLQSDDITNVKVSFDRLDENSVYYNINIQK